MCDGHRELLSIYEEGSDNILVIRKKCNIFEAHCTSPHVLFLIFCGANRRRKCISARHAFVAECEIIYPPPISRYIPNTEQAAHANIHLSILSSQNIDK